jgi:hypothetical protein
MTLRETAESVFDEVDDAAIYEADNTNLPSPFFVPVPSLDAAVITTTINEDGTAVPAIDFSWGVSNSEVVDYYDFQWKLSTDATYNSTVLEEPRFRIAPALSNVAYDYRVRAVNTLGIKSNYASSVSPASTGNDLTIPNPPTALVAQGGYSTVKLTWTPPTTNTDASTIRDLFQYQIFRGTTTNPTVFVGRVSGESFTDGGLADDTTYYYRVKAQDFTGNLSAYSANRSVTTEVAPVGERGAGRWNIGVTSLPTNSTTPSVNTAFVAAIGAPVDKDQAWFYTGTVANPTSQGVWLYDASTPIWVEQDEVIDGNLLVTGTVTANAIAAGTITADEIDAGTITATQIIANGITRQGVAGSGVVTNNSSVWTNIASFTISNMPTSSYFQGTVSYSLTTNPSNLPNSYRIEVIVNGVAAMVIVNGSAAYNADNNRLHVANYTRQGVSAGNIVVTLRMQNMGGAGVNFSNLSAVAAMR